MLCIRVHRLFRYAFELTTRNWQVVTTEHEVRTIMVLFYLFFFAPIGNLEEEEKKKHFENLGLLCSCCGVKSVL